MSRDKGYLQTISCSISLSSCRIRAESIARALNSRLWPVPGFRVKTLSNTYDTVITANPATGCATTSVIEKPPHAVDMFKTADGYERGHCWVNEMPAEDEESYDTPPCSSPPSPADSEIIVNPPTSLPFCAKFLSDLGAKNDTKHSGKNHSIFSEEARLRDKLQQYADSLPAEADGSETFYDASDNEVNKDGQECSSLLTEDSDGVVNDEDCAHSNETLSCNETQEEQNDVGTVLIEIHSPENPPESNCVSVDVPSNRRLREVQDLEEEERPKLLRSTSLKTGKTPPGTPGRKKIVRFADVLGLDLEAVRHIVCEDLPHVPSSAFDDLNLPPETDNHPKTEPNPSPAWESVPTTSGTALCSLYPLFHVPGTDQDFLDRVRKDWVCLESTTVSLMSVHCVCRVLNVTFEKQVVARYTMDDWRTWDEVLASYVPFSSDGEFDKFSFSLFLNPGTQEDERLSFAIRYTAGKSSRWDNNKGQNYTFRYAGNDNSVNMMLPGHELDEAWLYHFC